MRTSSRLLVLASAPLLLLPASCGEGEGSTGSADDRAGATFRGAFETDTGVEHGEIVLRLDDEGVRIVEATVDADPARYPCPSGTDLPEGGKVISFVPGLEVGDDASFEGGALAGEFTSASEAEGTLGLMSVTGCPVTLSWTATAD